MPKKKYQSPAKIKYDKSHPIVSFRTTPDLDKKLDEIKHMSDKSVADILKEAVGLQAPSAKDAYEKGYLVAKYTYLVTYKCSVCGEIMEIHTPNEKKAVAQYMKEDKWGHSKCLDK